MNAEDILREILLEHLAAMYGLGQGITGVRFFWKIIVEVRGGHIRVVKRFSLWVRANDSWCRFIAIPIRLESTPNNVGIQGNFMKFEQDDSYIQVTDHGLLDNIAEMARRIEQLPIVEVVRSRIADEEISAAVVEEGLKSILNNQELHVIGEENVGRNVYVEADIDTAGYVGGPIFVFPQVQSENTCDALMLKEVPYIGMTKRVEWQIMANDNGISNGTRNFCADGFHTLIVDQYNCDGESFRYLVDAIPLVVDERGIACRWNSLTRLDAFPFSSEQVVFYIGYDPYESISFKGKIKRIVFDPNASCLGCT